MAKKRAVVFYNPKTGLWYKAVRTKGGKLRIVGVARGRRKKKGW